jgi:hypothetical protein
MTFPSDVAVDYHVYGFKADHIYSFLARNGISLDPSSPALSGEKPAANRPDWVRPYKGRRQISLGDAATILAGLSPAYAGYRSDGEYAAAIRGWRDALIDAIGDHRDPYSEINASTWGTDQDAEQMLDHADIRAWCARRGHVWPIPDLDPQPATSAEALAEIGRLKAEVERYKAELAEAKEGINMDGHDRYASELDIATIAWRAAATGWSENLPGAPTPTEFIKAWVGQHYPDLAPDAVSRIATVANWDKRRGRKPKSNGST